MTPALPSGSVTATTFQASSSLAFDRWKNIPLRWKLSEDAMAVVNTVGNVYGPDSVESMIRDLSLDTIC